VHHSALIADPVGSVAALYRHFDLPPSPDLPEAIRQYVRQRPRGGYGPRNYRFEDHGLVEASEREKFRRYVEHFAIA
jgi:hypothetical protein